MGAAMLEGWLKLGLDPKRVTCIDPGLKDEPRDELADKGLTIVASAADLSPPQALVLAIKPQMLDAAAAGLGGIVGPRTLVISILAGKTIADLKARLPKAGAIVRAMPNTPAAVGRGITAAVANPAVSADQRAMADALLKAIGRVEWLDDEGLIDAVTAVSGSGPAYVFHLVEAMAAAGAKAGLPTDLAMRLARATVEGAGELMFQSPLPPSTLRENVTSPAGTTAAALKVLMDDKGLTALMTEAIAAAKRRAEELSG
ncbi:pyrroline-5-carboxylate reductase [Terrarubrum flagellatum]|uniref:pyrroline-5-carboxylate reductase n=1 Tax=Terrirubrum flagellatum TaxID=2895980 RepID=UPI0031456B91